MIVVNDVSELFPTLARASLAASASAAIALCSCSGSLASLLGEKQLHRVQVLHKHCKERGGRVRLEMLKMLMQFRGRGLPRSGRF